MARKGRVNSAQRVLRRRKAALVRREVNVQEWTNKEFQPEVVTTAREAKLALAQAEVAALKKHVGIIR